MNDINEKVKSTIRKAEDLYGRYSRDILEIPGFSGLLKDYRRQIEKSKRIMEELGLPDICTYCAVHLPGGGCCGEEIASWYDPVTLLFNLFFEIEFPQKPYYQDSCLFLARDGCMLLARYHFCVNYLCSRITTTISPNELSRLVRQSGRELYAAWRLEVILRQFFHAAGLPSSSWD